MERALIVCDNEKACAFYKSYLKENGYIDMLLVESISAAKRAITDYDFDICFVNLPLGGSNSIEQVIDIAEKNVCQVLLFIKADLYDEITDKVADYGIITVSKPISKQLLWQALRHALAAQRRIGMAHKESAKLEKKLEELTKMDEINQQTPLRVLRRRTDMVRVKHVLDLKCDVIDDTTINAEDVDAPIFSDESLDIFAE